MIIQGQETTDKDIALVREMISSHPSWGRTRLSKELATLWNWRVSNGQLKDIACRSFLLKLEKRGYLTLPPRQRSFRGNRKKIPIPYVPHKTAAIACKLACLTPVHIELVKGRWFILS